jgi:alpha-glucosidase
MQWSGSEPDAGFSAAAKTWLPVGADAATVNVATETVDPNSLLNWYRTLIEIRRRNLTMHDGGMLMLDTTNPSVLSYLRTAPAGARPIVVSLNMTAQPQTMHLNLRAAGIVGASLKTLLGDRASLQQITSLTYFTLPPYGSLVAEVQ